MDPKNRVMKEKYEIFSCNFLNKCKVFANYQISDKNNEK